MTKIDHDLFTSQASAGEVCPACHGKLVIKSSQHGHFWGCEHYPACDYVRPLVEASAMEAQVIPGSVCPECGHELAVKSGRFGLFIGCTHYPECHHIEKHLQEEVAEQVSCPVCTKGLLEHRTSRFGKSFYACNAYPDCKFIVNHKPVAQRCPDCGFAVLVERKSAKGRRLECPQKACHYKKTKN